MPGALVFATLFPFAPLGAAAASVYALANAPLQALTGVGRWDVHLLFSAMGAAISLWIVMGPALAASVLAARLAGLRGALTCGAAAGAAAFVGLCFLGAYLSAGGLAAPGLAEEAAGWAKVLVLPCALGAGWTVACVAVALRLRLRVERRGVEPGGLAH